jgi:hypothetical protein
MANIDKFLQTSPTEIIAELEALRVEKDIIARKEALLEQLVDLIFQEQGPAAAELYGYRTSIAVGPLRYQIRQVLLAEPERPQWLPKEVHDELVVRGNAKVTLDNVRVTMRRMGESGELERLDDDNLLFRLPVPTDNPPDGVSTE